MGAKRLSVVVVLVGFVCSVFADQYRISKYDTARDKYFWPILYQAGGNTLYCGQTFADRTGLQVEHTLPASWMKEAAGCPNRTRNQCRAEQRRFNLMEADLHNLWPSIGAVNQARSNHPFAIIPGEVSAHPNCDFELQNNQVEPRPEVRGEIARSLLYMSYEYGVELPQDQLLLMIQWHHNDPPSEHEVWRNQMIHSLQGTRNLYIENPN